MSKGHAAAALYAVLAESGFFPLEKLETFYQNGTDLPGHVTHKRVPGVEVSTGSLGHGLPIGVGMALYFKRAALDPRVFVMLSDGECDEGSNWEAFLSAPRFKLDNLVVIIDYNKIQSLGSVDEVIPLDPLGDKLRAFHWGVVEIDGHDIEQVRGALARIPYLPNKPTCVIAHTVKGKGVSYMENQLLWHYRWPRTEDVEQAVRELEEMR